MNPWLRNFLLLALMLSAYGMALALRPTIKVAEHAAVFDLEKTVPAAFADWRQDMRPPQQVVNPVQEENLNRIYNQILSRTYVSSSGYRVMLSVAYGNDQRSGVALAVHYPEVCYPAQGFEVDSNRIGSVSTVHGAIPVRLLETRLGNSRHEPVTYWITLGNQITLGGLNRRLIELRYGLEGEIPDGLLFRVSSEDADSAKAFELHAKFIADLLLNLSPEQRVRLAGKGAH